jgi:hypothetical protein
MLEYAPHILQTIDSTLGFTITENEKGILNALRLHVGNSDPKLFKEEQKDALKALAEELMR